ENDIYVPGRVHRMHLEAVLDEIMGNQLADFLLIVHDQYFLASQHRTSGAHRYTSMIAKPHNG
ncbi:hypothetical protein ABTL93_19080, partial [Acinetobacter baumannii]